MRRSLSAFLVLCVTLALPCFADDARAQSDAAAHLQAAAALRARGRDDKAAEEYARGFAQQPDAASSQFPPPLKTLFAQAHADFGQMLLDEGKTSDAAVQERAALALDPELPQAHLVLGLVLRRSGQSDAARTEWRQAAAGADALVAAQARALLNPPPPPPGDTPPSGGTWAKAEAQARKDLRRDPKNTEALFDLGQALYHLGRYDEAAAALQNAARLDSPTVALHNNLALLYDALGRPDDAIREYRRALRLDKGDATVHANLGAALYGQNRWAEAADEFQKAIHLTQSDGLPNPMARFNLGLALLKQEQWPAAARAFRDALRDDPQYAAACLNLGLAEDRQGHTAEAIARYRQALALDPDPAAALVTLSSTLADALPSAQAAAQFEAAAPVPLSGVGHLLLGNLRLADHRPDDALAEFQAAVRAQPQLSDAHYALCRALLRRDAPGDADEAERECRETLRLAPQNAAAHNTLGLLLYQSGHPAEGRAEWQRALALPDPDAARNAQGFLRAFPPDPLPSKTSNVPGITAP